jgi:tRNA A37 threonylcarbamoyladenosine biosynthesis protein TsaE
MKALGDMPSTATKGLSNVLVDIALKRPEVVHVRGPTGSGKTTLRHSVVKHLKERGKFVIE